MQDSPSAPYFFFWLFGWDTEFVSGYLFQPHYTFCRVDKEELYLQPMNVFRLNPSWSEIKALAQVLDHVKHNSTINLDPNPYIRNPQLWRGNQPPADGWNPTTPPYVYTAPLTLSKLLLALALGLLLALIVVPTLAYLLYLLLGSR